MTKWAGATEYLLYNPDDFKNIEIKPDTTREELEALRAALAAEQETRVRVGNERAVALLEIEALRAENARLREALKPFARQRLSSETHTTTLEYLSPLGEWQKQIAQIEKRDAEIRTARAAMGETE